LNKSIDVDLEFFDIEFDKMVDSGLPQVVHQNRNERDSRKNYYNMSVHLDKLHQDGIDCYPKVEIHETSSKYAHKLVVVGDLLVVLEAEHYA
jgi:hypothetical protein